MGESTGNSMLSVPKGFKIVREADKVLHLEYRASGMGCIVLFLLVWLSAWTVPCVVLVTAAIALPQPIGIVPGLFAVPFVGGEVAVAGFLLWIFFGRTDFVLAPEGLTVTKRLFAWSKCRVFPIDEIEGFTQIRDGGRRNSLLSWGLVVNAATPVKILSRQEPAKGLWLGGLLEKWSGKKFRRSRDAAEEF